MRRQKYTELRKRHRLRAEHVRGNGDVVYRVFQCLNYRCTYLIQVPETDIKDGFEITCPACGFVHRDGEDTIFFSYDLVDLREAEILESGDFSMDHALYIQKAARYKYCVLCNTLQPLENFDRHARRESGRQSECRICKQRYNMLKNPTRLTEQHRESADRRRLLVDVSREGREPISSEEIFQRFGGRCFKCGKQLAPEEAHIDHILPVFYLWPRNKENSALLCEQDNLNKGSRWPSEFYNDRELRRLSRITGLDYDLLAGPPRYNPEALQLLQQPGEVDRLIEQHITRMREVIRLRNRVLYDCGIDFFAYATNLADTWRKQADQEYDRIYKQRSPREPDQ